MNKTSILRKTVSLLLVLFMLAADLATPIAAVLPDDSLSLLSAISDTPIDQIDLSNIEVGLLTDTTVTNYKSWKDSQNASVSVKEEDGQKYINVKDDDAEKQPAIQRKDIDFGSGVKTIAFDLRVNQQSTEGVVFELYDMGSGASYVRVEFNDIISYGNGKLMTKLPNATIEDEWVSVIAVIDGENNKYTLYYSGEAIITDAAPRVSSKGVQRDFKDMAIDLEIRSNKTNTGSDFDVRNYALYTGDQASKLLGTYVPELVPIETIDLSNKEVGLLTDSTLTNYSGWSDSQNAQVSIMADENGQKYINVKDNDAGESPSFQRLNIDFTSGVKTLAFDMRINELGTGTAEIALCDITSGSNWVKLDFTESHIYYYLTKSKSSAGAIPTMDDWVQVILVINAEKNSYSFFYDGKEILYDTPPVENRLFKETVLDLQIRGSKTSVGPDFDIRDYRIYSGNVAYTLIGKDDPNAPVDVNNAGTTGKINSPLNINMGLPYSDNYQWTTSVDITTSAYENYLAKRGDLADATRAAGGSADEVQVLAPVSIKGAVEVYVSPDGDDSNNGSKEEPLQTIRRALTFVEELEKAGAQGVLVYLRAGTYPTEKAININAAHSGKNNIPVIISAYPDEEVILTGCIDFSGSLFTAVTDEAVLKKLPDDVQDKVVAFDLKELGLTDFGSIRGYNAYGGPNYSVQINGKNLTLARYPNENEEMIPLSGTILDFGPITGKSSFGPEGTNSTSTGIEFVMTDTQPRNWDNDGNIWFKGALYAEWRTQNQRVAAINENSIKLEADITGDAKVYNCGAFTNSHSKHYYYNILEELDVPGEYYVDTTNGILYMYPTDDLSDATVTYTRATNTLMQIRNAQNVVINGLIFENTAGSAVNMYNCNQVVVQNCIIRNVGTGVLISGEKSGVINSEFRYVNGRSVYFTDREFSRNNFLQNCLFDPGAGREKTQEILVCGKGHVISHNLLQDTFNNSIHLTWATECIVEYNEIVGGPTGTQDGGSIYQYSAGDTYNNHIRFNYIHDTGLQFESSTDPWAIYFDDASCGSFAYGNIIQNTHGGLFTNSGSEHVFAENIIRDGLSGTTSSINVSDKFAEKSWADFTAYKTDYQTYLEKYQTDESFREELAKQSPAMARRYQNIMDDLEEGRDGTGVLSALNNYAANNIMLKHGGIKGYTSINRVGYNYQNDTYDIFVDFENGDLTLKEAYVQHLPGYKAPDMSRMGIVEYQLEDPIVTDWITTSLLLNNDLNMKFYVPAEHLQEGDYLRVTMEGKAPVDLKVWKDGTGNNADKKYVTFEGIYATQMTVKVTVELCSADGQAKENYTIHEDSICEYAKRLAASNAATKWMRLMDAVLKYGAAAQKAATSGTIPEEDLPTYGWDWKLTVS